MARPRERPPGFGYSVIVRPNGESAARWLDRFGSVWSVVASWGRYCDEDQGQWPTTETCLAALPVELSGPLRERWATDLDNWLSDLHDRDWIVWSSAVVGDRVKIDLDSDSGPLSSWAVQLVATVLGAVVEYADLWVESVPSPRAP